MPKSSQIEKAIASLEAEIKVLQLAIAKLQEQQKAPKKSKAAKRPQLVDAS